jgi:hypothetical protein
VFGVIWLYNGRAHIMFDVCVQTGVTKNTKKQVKLHRSDSSRVQIQNKNKKSVMDLHVVW